MDLLVVIVGCLHDVIRSWGVQSDDPNVVFLEGVVTKSKHPHEGVAERGIGRWEGVGGGN